MIRFRMSIAALFAMLALAGPVGAEEVNEEAATGTVFTLWPLIDYRTSPADDFSTLSLLGPIVKFQRHKEERDVAVRPFFYKKSFDNGQASSTHVLYPLAYSENTPAAETTQVLQLFRKNVYRKQEEAEREKSTMLFPFYISGESDKYGPYRAVFPFYGDIYERFWRDEYHFFMFPFYGSTVNRGTTTRHYLWPIFSTTKGENEDGFGVFPLYGQSQKAGVYEKRYALWPVYKSEKTGLDTDNPTTRKIVFPLYAATDSPKVTSRTYLWPFFGYTENREKDFEEVRYLWPLVTRVRGEQRDKKSFLPFYSHETTPTGEKSWYLWPLYKHEELQSDIFRQDIDRVLFFLYRSNYEYWPKDGNDRRRTALWPLFIYQKSTDGVRSFSLPAPVEPILPDKEGIERNWAPLWRVYQRRWDDAGNSASSLLWNLYWHERRGNELAFELFPLVSYRDTAKERELKLLKGLISLKRSGEEQALNLFWLPFGPKWGHK